MMSTDVDGYDVDMFKDKTKALQYKCGICDKICNNPVELSCDDDDDSENEDDSSEDEHVLLYCKLCLSQKLTKNNNQCPINPKHTNVSYNLCRNIRKRINNLIIYCPMNNDEGPGNGNKYKCDWTGKLLKLSIHLKECKLNAKPGQKCQICGDNNIDQHTLIEHNDIFMMKHIDILFKTNKLLNDENSKLKKEINQVKCDFNEWKISFNIESTKKELAQKSLFDALEKELSEQKQLISSLSDTMKASKTENKQEQTQEDTMKSHEKHENGDHGYQPLIPKLINKNKSLPLPVTTNLNNNKKPAILKRTASMKMFHPQGTEWYHPKKIHYEMYHPKKATQVWVSKNIGSMAKLDRYPCCGSAQEASVFLVLKRNNKDNKTIYTVENKKLPNYWFDDIHLGCKQNKKRNKHNMSYYPCCKQDIFSKGCKKRYKCCKADVNCKSKGVGCKVGWQC